MKKSRVSNIIQGPLVAVLAGVGLNVAFMNSGNFSLTGEQMVNIPVAESLGGFFNQFTLPDFGQIGNSAVWVTALTIAVVASLETLLCVEATDKLDPQKRVTPTNRELTAQGIGNMISGLIGGLPVTQVIVRSSANIQSGGRTKASAFIHGILLLVSAMAIPHLLNLIPLASLAAILFLVGYKLAKPALFVAMYKMGRAQFIPFIVTILGIVFTDLLMGIGMGLVVAIFHILWNNYKVPYHFDPKDYVPGEKVRIQLAEDVSFLNKASIQRTLNSLPEDAQVVIDASRARTIHPDILEIFEDFRTNRQGKNIQLELVGMTPDGVKIDGTYDPVKGFNEVVAPENLQRKNGIRSILAE
jgi:MFS superfamily sulfate permease-like transporter